MTDQILPRAPVQHSAKARSKHFGFFTAREFLALASLYVVLVGLAVTDLVHFSAWDQVKELHYSTATIEMLYEHPHFFRYMLAYPGLRLSDIYGDIGFSFYVSNFEAASVIFMYILLRQKNPWIIIFAIFSIVVIHFFMNGRGAMSWLGWMVVLYLMFSGQNLSHLIRWPILLLGLWCCSVSSGTFSVAFVAVFGWYFLSLRKRNLFSTAIIVALILYAFWGLFLEGLERNLIFYTLGTGNPVINMLRHGSGAIILDHPVVVVVALIVTLVSGFTIFLLMSEKPRKEELIAIFTPLFGGIFGYTTLTLIIPSTIVVLARRLGRARSGGGAIA